MRAAKDGGRQTVGQAEGCTHSEKAAEEVVVLVDGQEEELDSA